MASSDPLTTSPDRSLLDPAESFHSRKVDFEEVNEKPSNATKSKMSTSTARRPEAKSPKAPTTGTTRGSTSKATRASAGAAGLSAARRPSGGASGGATRTVRRSGAPADRRSNKGEPQQPETTQNDETLEEGTARASKGSGTMAAVKEPLAAAPDIDLAVLDITMPRMTGLQAAAELHRRAPQVRTLILSMHDDAQYFFQALRAGASGYVLKSAADRDLVEACRATMRGEPFVHAGAVAALIEDYLDRVRNGEQPGEDPLTPREVEVLKLIAEAWTNEQIAAELVISIKTVERHRANMMDKLGMRDRVQLTRYAIRRGLVAP